MYTEWIALAPDSFQGYNNLGAVYLLQGRYGEAIPQLRRSAEINPSLDAYSNLGTAYFYQGSMPEAARAYREAVRVGEHDSDVYYAWGNLAEAYYWGPGERERAAETYRHAIALGTERLEVNPRNAGVLSDLALYHAMLLEKGPASELLQRALRLSPDDPAIQLLAAKVQVQFGQYPAAMAALERSRKLGTSAFVVRDDPEFRPLASEVHYQNVARP
jgi:tetratricopeptide (TPR) repeat protein